MKKGAFIWIQVKKPEEIQFTNPLADWFKSPTEGKSVYDFDNHSEAFIIDRILEIVNQYRKLILVIEATELETGQVTRFLNRISRITRIKDQEIAVFFNGRNEMIEKMAKVIGGSRFYPGEDPDNQKKIISEFLETP